ncbi:hypothetical protein A5724_29850 [Mycobacterium sp. ACS1612]|uniref:alpha/beta fold hydrolase n=1 Tax=Mycobacterium sp. ACS1612 TaxID=1834117 RepID=UPI00080032F7|nr:alpha/beta fold hydrolase [Mycobacterium sp. ACS1612]OBF27805.1 hypothetical protein A5724_29850 [Mycobacterium sp. ACS1612]
MSPTLLFVHSPVAGPSTWHYVAEVLQQNGFRCLVPDLTGVAAAGGPYYPKYATAAAAAVDGEGAVALVGHSAAGALLPVVAEGLGDRVRAAVFVDAMLPQPGRSWFDTAPPGLERQLRGLVDDGVLPPYHEWFPPGTLAELVPDAARRDRLIGQNPQLPVAYFDEPAPPARFADSIACAFVRLGAPFDAAADKAERLGWWVTRRDWDHLRMLSDPDGVADLIAHAISATHPD